MRVHIVTRGFVTANGQGFLAPILRLRRRLADEGADVRFFPACGDTAADCDVLAIESGVLRGGWGDGSSRRILEQAARANPSLAYFDIQDSTGTIQAAALDCVAVYLKNQLLRDRALYERPYYGGRLYTDFYHRKFGVEDTEVLQSQPIPDPRLRAKLRVSWNSGLADYGVGGIVRREAYARIALPMLLRRPSGFVSPGARRTVGLGFRMTLKYDRKTIAFQRIEVARRLGFGREERLSRRAFMQELARTKVVASPFGWGEINLRDYEAYIAGSALLKPDMAHLETWPDFYAAGCYVPFRWDLSDLAGQAERVVSDDDFRIAVAERAQETYRRAAASEEGDTGFCARFASLMRAARDVPGVGAVTA